jgi:hypothetical protein
MPQSMLDGMCAASTQARSGDVGASAGRAVAYPVARAGAEASCPVAWVGELAALDRETAAADALGQPVLEALELRDALIDPGGPRARETRPISAGWRAVRRQLPSSAPITSSVSPIRWAKTMNAIRRSTGRG